MKRGERKVVKAVHDSAEKLLSAKGYAETYVARVEFCDAIVAMNQWAEGAMALARLEVKEEETMNEKPDNSIEALGVVEAARRVLYDIYHMDESGTDRAGHPMSTGRLSMALQQYDEKYPWVELSEEPA